jgi:hypothetical protein
VPARNRLADVVVAFPVAVTGTLQVVWLAVKAKEARHRGPGQPERDCVKTPDGSIRTAVTEIEIPSGMGSCNQLAGAH